MKRGVVVELLLLLTASSTWAYDAGRYVFGGAPDQGTFVLDNQTGRVWRYDRVDDAWYLYDLEALGRSPHGEPAASGPRREPDKDPGGKHQQQDEYSRRGCGGAPTLLPSRGLSTRLRPSA